MELHYITKIPIYNFYSNKLNLKHDIVKLQLTF